MRHGGGGHVKTDEEIEAMLPQAKECQKPPDTGKGKEEMVS